MTPDEQKAEFPRGTYHILGGEDPDRRQAAFRLIGERLDPDAVTRAIGLVPSSAHRKDEARPVRLRSPELAPWPVGLWSLESADDGETNRLSMEGHLTYLLDQLEPKAETIRRLCGEQDLRADFYCGYFMHQSNSGFEFSAATLARISALNASLGFDVYGPSSEDGDRTEIVD
jgi:hypothetical protein